MTVPLRILIACPWDTPFGGVVSVVGNLAHHLTRRGHSVVLLHPGERDTLEPRTTAWGFEGYRLRLRPPWMPERPLRSALAFPATLPRTLAELARLWDRYRFDVVNVHFPIADFVALAGLRQVRRSRLVTSVHGADLFPDGHRRHRYPLGLRLLLAGSDRLVAPSVSFRDDCVRLFPRLAGRSVAILNGIDLTRLDGPLVPPPDGRLVVCVAAPQPKKGLDVLLRAWAELGELDPACRLEIVGEGPQRGQLERMALDLGLGGRVRFRGALGEAEVVALLRGCEAFVLPSRSEPFGLATVEAMACGKPVVVSAVGGLTEIVTDGETGLLVPAGDPAALAAALRRVLGDGALRARLGEAGQRRARKLFGYERMGAEYEALFREIAR